MINSKNPSPSFTTPTRARVPITIVSGVTNSGLTCSGERVSIGSSAVTIDVLGVGRVLIQRENVTRLFCKALGGRITYENELAGGIAYRLGGPGTTVLHLSARDFTDLGLTPGARTVHLFGATFTRIETN